MQYQKNKMDVNKWKNNSRKEKNIYYSKFGKKIEKVVFFLCTEFRMLPITENAAPLFSKNIEVYNLLIIVQKKQFWTNTNKRIKLVLGIDQTWKSTCIWDLNGEDIQKLGQFVLHKILNVVHYEKKGFNIISHHHQH